MLGGDPEASFGRCHKRTAARTTGVASVSQKRGTGGNKASHASHAPTINVRRVTVTFTTLSLGWEDRPNHNFAGPFR
jgi:hypothetical protein